MLAALRSIDSGAPSVQIQPILAVLTPQQSAKLCAMFDTAETSGAGGGCGGGCGGHGGESASSGGSGCSSHGGESASSGPASEGKDKVKAAKPEAGEAKAKPSAEKGDKATKQVADMTPDQAVKTLIKLLEARVDKTVASNA
jgi:hypothetical protein